MRRQISDRTLLATALAVAAAFAAHMSGKPWWVDHPFLGDAYDVGVLSFVAFRVMLWLAD
jgi:hypothetical protein